MEILSENQQKEERTENLSEDYFQITKQVGISYFFNFLILISQPLLIFLLTRTLSIEDFGTYSLLFVTISILSVFLRFGLVYYLTTKIPGLNEEARTKNIITVLTFYFGLIIIICTLFYFFRNPIINFLGIEKQPWLWTISIFLITATVFYELISSYLLSIKKIFVSSFSGFIMRGSGIMILALILLYFGTFSLKTAFMSLLFGVLSSLGLVLFFLKPEISYFIHRKQKLDLQILTSALKFSLPLVFFVAFVFIMDSSDRYIINYFLGKSEVAIYSLAISLVSMIITIPTIFQSVIQPYFAEKWNLKLNSSLLFNVMLKYSLLVTLPSIAGMFVLREEMVYLISGTNYSDAVPLVAILLSYPLFSVLMELFNKTLLLREMIKEMILIYLIGAGLNVALNLIFVPIFGAVAATYVKVISYLFILIALLYLKPKEINLNWNFLKIGRIILASFFMAVIINQLNPEQYWLKILTITFGIVIYGAMIFYFNVFDSGEKKMMALVLAKIKDGSL